MDEEKIEKIVFKGITKLIDETVNSDLLRKKYIRNKERIHFLPIKYMNFNSFMSSLNIKYGDFVEKLIVDLIKEDKRYSLSLLSGKKIQGKVSDKENKLITEYIEKSQNDPNFKRYNLSFLDNSYEEIKSVNISVKKDIDLLLYDKNKNFYLFEIKLFDNHDTGKVIDIHRKLFYTAFALRRYFEEENIEYKKIFPNLFYFDGFKKMENIFLKENVNLFRGEMFWKNFSNLKFNDLKKALKNTSENLNVREKIDLYYEKVDKILD